MIWFTLALFVVSFVLTALLAPEPNIENARADVLNPDNFPRATEDAPIPLILGKVRMNAPNTIWWGNFYSIPITERIKVSLFKKKTVTVGHDYYVTLDLALGMGPNTKITKIFMDDKLFWEGTVAGNAPTLISKMDATFFGGRKEGGGFSITGTYYPGSLDLLEQPVDSLIEGLVGGTNVPAYLGTAHLAAEFYLGESPTLRKIAFVMENYSNFLALSNNGMVGEDMNPAEAIWQIMTDTWRGMGVAPDEIDIVALRAVGETLYTEGNGCSVVITAESDGKKLITELLRQIDGVAYQDPSSGKIKFVLIRDDYNPDDLPIFDEDDVVAVKNFSRSGWDEVMGQVKITFPQLDKESSAVAISQDMATIATVGRLRSTTMSMPFVYDATLANNIASRERAQLSVPLFRIELEMNRNANTLRPGSVFRLNWPEYGFVNLVLRVQEFDLGSLLDGRIVMNCLQDSFALNETVFAPPSDSTWVRPVTETADILVYDVVEAPRFLNNQAVFPTADGYVCPIQFAGKPQAASTSYTVAFSDTAADPDPTFGNEYNYYTATGTLSAAYLETSGIATGLDTTDHIQIANAVLTPFLASVTEPEIREGSLGLLYMGGEWLAYTVGVDNGGGSFTLQNVYRGLLGTTPKTHSIGTRIWQFDLEHLSDGSFDELIEGDTVYYNLLDRNGPRVQDLSEVTERSKVLDEELGDRPVRPGNLQLDGARIALVVDATDRDLTWVPRNRAASQIAFEQDAAETPDQTETYDVEVWTDGIIRPALGGTGVSSPYTIPFNASLPPATSNGEIRVYSRRTGTDLRRSAFYGMLKFEIIEARLLLSGDEQSGTDKLLLSGDEQAGTDVLKLSGDEA